MRNILPMKTLSRLSAFALIVFSACVPAFSQHHTKLTPAADPQNLVRGLVGPISSDPSWAGFSVENVIPGSGLFPITSTTTVFYLGFASGTEADISNMVLYTTARGSLKITASTPIKFNGVSNPSLVLTKTSVCPTQPVSTTNPCVVRLDPAAITLSPSSDYYLMIYFTNNSNNSSLGAVEPGIATQSTLSSAYFSGKDYTQLAVGQSLPGVTNRPSNFLMYVMTN